MSCVSARVGDQEGEDVLDALIEDFVGAAIRYAADHGRSTAWQLAWAIATYLGRHGHWQDWPVVARLALDAANAHGDRLGRAHASAGLGRAHGWLGRHDDAIAELERTLSGFTEIGDRVGQATVHGHLAWLLDRREYAGRHQDGLLLPHTQ